MVRLGTNNSAWAVQYNKIIPITPIINHLRIKDIITIRPYIIFNYKTLICKSPHLFIIIEAAMACIANRPLDKQVLFPQLKGYPE